MKKLGVIGLGLMGGSLGMAIKKGALDCEVRGYARREETRRLAREMNAVDEVFADPKDVLASCELAILCLPVLTIPAFLQEHASAIKTGAVITDVGSTKQKLQQDARKALESSSATFLGSHPICGSEKRGIENGNPNLYENAVTIVTPDPDTDSNALDKVVALWESVGCRVLQMAASQHDACLARSSHLPHLSAAILSATVGRDDTLEHLPDCCGTGFQDATRLAEGHPGIWRDIVGTNRPRLIEEVAALRETTDLLLNMLERDDIAGAEDFLAASRKIRRNLLKGQQS